MHKSIKAANPYGFSFIQCFSVATGIIALILDPQVEFMQNFNFHIQILSG
jgi:hypothetical protein